MRSKIDRLVVAELQEHGCLAAMEIADRHKVSRDTVCGSVARLVERGIVEPTVPGRTVYDRVLRAYRLKNHTPQTSEVH